MRASGTLRRHFVHWLLLLALAASSFCAQAFPSIEIHGTEYPSTCQSTQWAELEALLHELADGRQPLQLIDLVRTYLCGSGTQADKRLQRRVARFVDVVSEESGIIGQTSSRTPRAEVTALAGQAWDASAQADEGYVWVSYAENEACATSVGFLFRQTDWTLQAMNGACD